MKGYFEVTQDDVRNAYKAGQQSQQTKIDELQARIDKTVNHIEEWYGCVELSNIVDMLKGNKDEN